VTTTLVPGKELQGEEARLAAALVRWLETGDPSGRLFAEDVFTDLSLPRWRLQGEGPEETADLRAASHPFPGEVTVRSLDRTSRGFLVELEERWDAEGQRWYCRELFHCAVSGDRVTQLSVYCTGDWDEAVQQRHTEQVRLTRP
jgi:hypothetical protein